jgi:hypothetical protein
MIRRVKGTKVNKSFLCITGSGQEQVESSCEFGIEPLGSVKCCETIEWPNNWLPLE